MSTAMPPIDASLVDAGAPIVEMMERGQWREAEVATAYLAVWLLDRVAAGKTARAEADQVFTTIDGATTRAMADRMSQAWRDLLTEGEHFHHFGEEWGADPDALRELAFGILRRGG